MSNKAWPLKKFFEEKSLNCSNVMFSNFLTFLTITCPSLSHALFYLYQTKSIFRPTSSYCISINYSSLVSLLQKKTDCTIFSKKIFTDASKGNLQVFGFSRKFRFKKFCKCFCTFKFIGSTAFQKFIICYNFRNFFLVHFFFITRYYIKYLDFCKFAIFCS